MQSCICNQSVRRCSIFDTGGVSTSRFSYCVAGNRFMLRNQMDIFYLMPSESLAWTCTCNSNPPVLGRSEKQQWCQMLLINHPICNKQSIDLESRGARKWRSPIFRPSELLKKKKGKGKKILCTVAMVFPFHSEPFSRWAPGVSALQLIDLFLIVPPLAAE